MKRSQIIIIGSFCVAEIIELVRTMVGVKNGLVKCLSLMILFAIYIIYLTFKTFRRKICPECKSTVSSNDRICLQCGHCFQKGISQENLTDYIEKDKEENMSSEQIDQAFEKIDSITYEQANSYDDELNDYLKK